MSLSQKKNMINCFTYLPPNIDTNRVLTCLGLISDTHIPIYCPTLPPILFEIFQNVNLILHAGDIGDLSVLDDLSRIAPVIAVRGNDYGDTAEGSLPIQQMVTAGRQRIFLYHSHHPDHEEEMRAHREDCWQPKLAERINMGLQASANIVVFGHTHIPLTYMDKGILLINPGAVAPASVLSRQLFQTVAILFILKDGRSQVVHIELSNPMEIFVPIIDWDGGFKTTMRRLSVSLIGSDLMTAWPSIETHLRNFQANPSNASSFKALFERLLIIARRCWAGEQQYITRADLIKMLDDASQDNRTPPQFIADLKALLSGR